MNREQIVYLPIEEITPHRRCGSNPVPNPTKALRSAFANADCRRVTPNVKRGHLGRTNTVRIRFVYRSVAVRFLHSLFKKHAE